MLLELSRSHGRDELGIPMAMRGQTASQNQPGAGIEWELEGMWSPGIGFSNTGLCLVGFSCRSLRFLPLPKVQPGFSISRSNKIQ